MVEAYESTEMKYGNAVLLNESTYIVSCEVKFNKNITIDYLLCKKKYLPMPNTKNCRGQMVSGTSSASIVMFLVYSCMLNMENVVKEIYRVEYWDNDAVVLGLVSPKTIPKLLECKFNYVGNYASLSVSLTFMKIRYFVINTRKLD